MAPQIGTPNDHLTNPIDFDRAYVRPAVELWFNGHQDIAHLAVHAITQFDVLAEVTALWTQLGAREFLDRGEAGRFRQAQGQREPALALICDIHDTHKHGRLKRQGSALVSLGQRPQMETHFAIICGETECGGDLTPYEALTVVFDNGSEKQVWQVLNEAREAWDREFARFSLTQGSQPIATVENR